MQQGGLSIESQMEGLRERVSKSKVLPKKQTPEDRSLRQNIKTYIDKVNQTNNPVQAVLYAGMLTKSKDDKTPVSNLDENIKEHRKGIVGFFRNALGKGKYDPRDWAWCAAFVDATLSKIGADRLGNKDKYSRVRARDYINYGEAVDLDNIREGDIIVLDFNKDGRGDHVGFYPGRASEGMFKPKGTIPMLGGNQSARDMEIIMTPEGRYEGGQIGIKNYKTTDVLGIRRITRDSKPWEGIKDENPLFYYENSLNPSYGFDEGGLSTDAEGRRRRRPSQAYLERSKESSKQIVENVAGMLPGVGTAMTVEEIQEELQKEDPNYRKVALLGGAELIGLIPGLGTAAKAGLRKVADRVGASKIVEALDTPIPKPQSEIIAGEQGLTPAERVSRKRSSKDSPLGRRYPLQTARDMRLAGKTNDEIEAATGLEYDDKAGIFRFEIDDTTATFKPDYNSKGYNVNGVFTVKLSDLLGHPELYKRYPKLKDYEVKIKQTKDIKEASAFFSASTNTITIGEDTLIKAINQGNEKELKQTVLHEIQHAVQYLENFSKDLIEGGAGSNLESIRVLGNAPSLVKQRDRLKKIVEEFDNLPDHLVNGAVKKLDTKKAEELLDQIGFQYAVISANARNLYYKNMGEAEARVVENALVGDKSYSVLKRREEQIQGGYYEPFNVRIDELLVANQLKDMAPFKAGKESIKQNVTPSKAVNQILQDYGSDPNRARELAMEGLGLGRRLKLRSKNKGGPIMNRQMEMAFMQEGGLKDDGMKVDPVSGNQIPPGSMAKEVRDDIPAQLSEGEYVVPADVVQYYGVKHFENLRNKAKSGLAKMEKDGRIGGEPVPMGGPKAMAMGGPLTGEEMQEIQMMAQGGMIDPYQQQQAMYQQPKGMSSGGVPREFVTRSGPGFGRPIYTGEFSFEKPGAGAFQPSQEKTTVILYGPQGDSIVLTMPDDQNRYNDLISRGYTTTPPKPVQQPTYSGGGGDGGGMTAPPKDPWYKEVDFNNVSGYVDDILRPQQTPGIFGFTTPMISLISGVDKLGNVSKAFSSIELAKAAGKIGEDEYKKLRNKVDGYARDNNLNPKIVDTIASGTMRTSNINRLADDNDDGTTTKNELEDWMSQNTSTTTETEPTPTGDTSGDPRGDPDKDKPRPPSAGFGDEPPGAPGFPSQSTGGGGGGGGSSGGGESEPPGFPTNIGSGPFNKGGLMQRKR